MNAPTNKLSIEFLERRLMLSRAAPMLTMASVLPGTGNTASVGYLLPEAAATLSGGDRPLGRIVFTLAAPDGKTIRSEWVKVRGDGTYHTSSTAVASQTGVYTWHAEYYGDLRNNLATDQVGVAVSAVSAPVQSTSSEAQAAASTATPSAVVSRPVSPPPVVTTKPVGYQSFYETAATDHAVASKQAYYRYDWAQIEPAAGIYDFSAMAADFASAEAAGQQYNFRIMPYEDGGGGPVGLKKAGLPGSTLSFNGATTYQPDVNSLSVQADLDKLLAALGSRFGSGTATVDVGWWGSYGEWTNWGTSPALARPSTAATEWLISETKKYFPHSYTIVQESLATDDPAAFSFAMAAGCGVRYDGWGDWSTHGQWSNQDNEYPTAIAASGDQWKRAPIILEPWNAFSAWIGTEPWQKSFDWAINTAHAWMFSNKSSGPIPSVMQSNVNQLVASESLSSIIAAGAAAM
ncbi:MAG TPA: hypothetical protein VGH32_01620 [Pirellulales bacterium]